MEELIMNLKKLFAVGISVAMLSSAVVANAELIASYDDDYEGYVATQMPTKAEMDARTPSISIVAEECVATDVFAKAKAKKITDANGKVYKISYTISNLGDIFVGYDEDVNDVAVGIVSLTVSIPGIGNKLLDKKDGDGINLWQYSFKENAGTNALVLNTYAASPDKQIYPTPVEGGALIENASVTLTGYIGIAGEYNISAEDITTELLYNYGELDNLQPSTKSLVPTANLVIGETTPEPAVLGINASLLDGARQAHGYIWDTTITKGENEIKAVDVEFSADGYEPKTGTISNIDQLVKYGGDASIAFKIGLKTDKTLSGAKFTVTDVANESAFVNADV